MSCSAACTPMSASPIARAAMECRCGLPLMSWHRCSRRRLQIVPSRYVQNGRPGIVSRAARRCRYLHRLLTRNESWVQSRALRHRWLRPGSAALVFQTMLTFGGLAPLLLPGVSAAPLCALVGASAAISAAKQTMFMRILRAAPTPERASCAPLRSSD